MIEIAGVYHAVILWIGDGTGLPDAILHIHAGMAVLLVARLITRRSLGTLVPLSLVPLSLVATAEAANELLDWLSYGWRWADTMSDVANTLFWPSVICLAVRLRPLVGWRSGLLPSREREGLSVPPADGQALP